MGLVDGLTFARRAADPSDPRAAGNDSVENHTIALFDRAFGASNVRLGMPGGDLVSQAVYDVEHEIGRAVDRRGLRTAMTADKTAAATLRTDFGVYETSPSSGSFENIPGPEVAQFNRELRAAESANKAPPWTSARGHGRCTHGSSACWL